MGGFLSGVSAPELLAALAIPAGAALAYRGGRYTGPIGAGLAGFGGLGLALGQRQYQQQQRDQLQKQVASLSGMFPGDKAAKQFFDSAAGSGMTASEAFNAWQEKQHPKMSTVEEQIAAFNKDPKGFSAMESAMHPQRPATPPRPSQFEQELQAYQANPSAYGAFERATHPEKPDKPDKPSYTPLLGADGKIIGRFNSLTGSAEPLAPDAAGKFYKTAPKPPKEPKAPSFGESPEKIAGVNYKRVSAKGDPMTGILTLADAEPGAVAKTFGASDKPKFLWKINNKVVDPTKLSEADAKKYAEQLYKKGLTIDQIFPGMK